MRFLAALVVVFAVAFLASVNASRPGHANLVDGHNVDNELHAMSLFKKFQSDYNKSYDNADEEAIRFTYFKENLARAAELTKKSGGKTRFGVSPFMDMAAEEFKRTYNHFKPAFGAAAAARKKIPVHQPYGFEQPPASFDWRDHNAVTPVKDQGQCGSCWAFSATEEVESAWLRAGGSEQILAPQQTVDCDTVDQGCNGGDTISAYAYMESAGLETEAAYPYVSGESGSANACSYNKQNVVVRISNYTYATPGCTDSCPNQNEALLLQNLYEVGPASICVDASVWQTYTSGILDPSSGCSSAYTNLDHCVQLVGYGIDATSQEKYWIVRNSWNTNWGEQGYIRLKYGLNTCGVADEATFVQVIKN